MSDDRALTIGELRAMLALLPNAWRTLHASAYQEIQRELAKITSRPPETVVNGLTLHLADVLAAQLLTAPLPWTAPPERLAEARRGFAHLYPAGHPTALAALIGRTLVDRFEHPEWGMHHHPSVWVMPDERGYWLPSYLVNALIWYAPELKPATDYRERWVLDPAYAMPIRLLHLDATDGPTPKTGAVHPVPALVTGSLEELRQQSAPWSVVWDRQTGLEGIVLLSRLAPFQAACAALHADARSPQAVWGSLAHLMSRVIRPTISPKQMPDPEHNVCLGLNAFYRRPQRGTRMSYQDQDAVRIWWRYASMATTDEVDLPLFPFSTVPSN